MIYSGKVLMGSTIAYRPQYISMSQLYRQFPPVHQLSQKEKSANTVEYQNPRPRCRTYCRTCIYKEYWEILYLFNYLVIYLFIHLLVSEFRMNLFIHLPEYCIVVCIGKECRYAILLVYINSHLSSIYHNYNPEQYKQVIQNVQQIPELI